MTPNDKYRLAYHDLSAITSLDSQLKTAKRKAEYVFNEWAKHHMIVTVADHKKGAPKIHRTRWNLPAAEVEAKKKEIIDQHDIPALENALKRAQEDRERVLNELAQGVSFVPSDEEVCIASCDLSTYRSQGMQAVKYAEASLAPLRDFLRDRGFKTWLFFHEETKHIINTRLVRTGAYQLRANCPLWMADAAQRCITQEMTNKSYAAIGCNPLVF